MSLALLSNALGKRGISHIQSKVDAGFVKVYWIIDGASLPVVLVNVNKGTFLELRDFERLDKYAKKVLSAVKKEYKKSR
ncbi:Hypothetical protein Tpal_475 [Trichococcus palustris]|uniref:Uncharacterized protein n=1 Tax=Trichococcus palustris TaxID=140314 RepID=A0A143YA62_9LACT|nr:hypothetical protein [Trichococcus palustris]CZQ83684.1 Hypothetical protein Tpal_475 [Trichococcus palustris]SFK70368.1 hypothetical protein SAMN04488076_103185 [Trichococcus palustris]